jgi:hypothetical protein
VQTADPKGKARWELENCWIWVSYNPCRLNAFELLVHLDFRLTLGFPKSRKRGRTGVKFLNSGDDHVSEHALFRFKCSRVLGRFPAVESINTSETSKTYFRSIDRTGTNSYALQLRKRHQLFLPALELSFHLPQSYPSWRNQLLTTMSAPVTSDTTLLTEHLTYRPAVKLPFPQLTYAVLTIVGLD